MRMCISFAVVIFSLQGCSTKSSKEEIYSLMQQQSDAWNRGSIQEYMQPYWHDDSLMFIGKSGISYGYATVLTNYQKGYPDKEAMGNLTFDIKEFKQPGKNTALVVGAWELSRIDTAFGGHFTLTWKKINGEWKIIADHTS